MGEAEITTRLSIKKKEDKVKINIPEPILHPATVTWLEETVPLLHRSHHHTGVLYLGAIGPQPAAERVALVLTSNTFSLLPLRLDLREHSPAGPNWGYGGSGPAQLALALLAHATERPELACRIYQRFKFRTVARLPHELDWLMTRDWICEQAMLIAAELRVDEADEVFDPSCLLPGEKDPGKE